MKKFLHLVAAGLVASMPLFGSSFNPEQKKEIETIIKDYLIANPEVLIEVGQALQKKQLEGMQKQAKEAISKEARALFNSNSPTIGAKNGTIKIVEFLDYQCVHCKAMHDDVNNLIKNHNDLQVILKIFPVYGSSSIYAGKAALAAQKQGKFKEFHNALLSEKERLTDEKILSIAASVGLNTDQLKRDMDKFDPELEETMRLAAEIGIRGTPAFIIAPGDVTETSETIYLPGAVGERNLEEAIKKVLKN